MQIYSILTQKKTTNKSIDFFKVYMLKLVIKNYMKTKYQEMHYIPAALTMIFGIIAYHIESVSLMLYLNFDFTL